MSRGWEGRGAPRDLGEEAQLVGEQGLGEQGASGVWGSRYSFWG